MTIVEIERRLREAATDEPSVLPALVLPRVGMADGRLRDRSLDTTLGFGRVPWTMRIAVAALLLAAALVGAVVSGAIRLEQLRSPLLHAGEFSGRGVALTYPGGWERVTPDWVIEDGSSVAMIVSSHAVDGCSADEVGTLTPAPGSLAADGAYYMEDQLGQVYGLGDRIYQCMIEQPMHPGEIRVVLTQNAPQQVQIGPFGDFATPFYDGQSVGGWAAVVPDPALGFTEEVAGMPALLDVRDHSVIPGASEVRTWLIAGPDFGGSMWHVQAILADPGTAGAREQADEIARSFAYLDPPPPLLDADRDDAVAAVIDEFDRQMRRSPGSRLAGCLPRTPGEVTATVTEGIYATLREPIEVTCTTSVEPTAVRQWRVAITVAWPARDGQPAGRWGWELFVGADGTPGMQGRLYGTEPEDTFPEAWNESPPPGPLPELAAGTLVRVVGAQLQEGMLNQPFTKGGPSDSFSHLDGMPGTLLVVVDGPVRDDGLDWYRFDNGFEVGWAVPTADGRPLVEVAEPTCPDAGIATVEDLVYHASLEQRLCAGDRELTFGPSQYARREEVGGDPFRGDPAWLATEPPFWALFGSGGAMGIDPGLPAVLAPGVRAPASGAWVTVRGHFNDPAAATCSWTYPDGWNGEQAPPEVQHRRCAERFVITSIEPADAP